MQDHGTATAGGERQILQAFRDALAREAPSLATQDLHSLPRLFWQQLRNRLAWAPDTEGIVRAHEAREVGDNHPWLRLENPIVESAGLVTTIPLGGDLKLFSCDIAPDGQSMAVVAMARFAPVLSADTSPGGVLVLRLPDGLRVAQLTGHHPDAEGCAFSPAGGLLATSGDEGTVRVWRTGDYKCVAVLPHSQSEVYALTFSSDGRMLASGSTDGLVRVWIVGENSKPTTWTAHDGPTMRCAFSPQKDRLATCGHDGVARIWALDGRMNLELRGHAGWVNCIAFSPDGRWVSTGGADATVRLWDASTGQQVALLEGHLADVHECTFSADTSVLASASTDMAVRLWGVESRSCIATLTGHLNAVMGCRFAPGKRLLYTSALDGTVRAWSVPVESATSAETRHHAGAIHECRFSNHRGWILTASLDKTVRTWDVRPFASRAEFSEHKHEVEAVCDSPDGQLALSVGYDGGVMVSECASGKTVARLAGVAPAKTCDWSSAGDRVVIGWENGWVQMIDTFDSTRSWTVERYRGGVACARFSEDGRLLASASGDGRVCVADVGSLERLFEYQHHAAVSHCEFISGRDLLAVVDGGGGLTILSLTSSTPLQLQVRAHRSVASSCAVHPDGTLLATCGWDGRLRVWKIDDLSLEAELIARGPLSACDFDETGDMLCCADTGGNLYILRLEGRRSVGPGTSAMLGPTNRSDARVRSAEQTALSTAATGQTGASTDAVRQPQAGETDISRWSGPELALLSMAPMATLMVVSGLVRGLTGRAYSFDMTPLMGDPPGGRAHPNPFANAVLFEASKRVRSGNVPTQITLAPYARQLLGHVRDLLRSKANPVELTELRQAVFLMCRSMFLNAGAPAQLADYKLEEVLGEFLQ